MNKLVVIFWFSFIFAVPFITNAQERHFLKAAITVSPEVRSSYIKGGRLLLYLATELEKEPYKSPDIKIGVTPQNWDASGSFVFDTKSKEVLSSGLETGFTQPSAKIYYQAVYKQNIDDGQDDVPGNLVSNVDSVVLINGSSLTMNLNKIIPPYTIVSHKFVKTVVIKSKVLSDFWGRPRFLKASVLLPSGYFENPDRSYPICYRAPGLNGRYDGVNGMIANKDFYGWWFSNSAPQIIYVFLDSQGPYGDSYQVDSENNGPCGKALTEELIPEIEKQVHYKKESGKRFLAGASTGGWVALGLQIFYPDFFDGAWAYSPDPVDFEHYGLINIYQDKSVFYNRFNYLQPESRSVYGEPKGSMQECIYDENVLSRTGNYLISGQQFGAYNAVFGPKGKDGLPSLMFDPVTGDIDHAIAKQWEKYDLKKVLEKNWTILGPKLQGKIWVWSGDMDGLYSNVATRFLKIYLDKTENPKSDAKISFTPMAGHCQEWSDKTVLMMVAEKASGR
ncbi:MAG: alpha/beta hydrolase-fold protein [Mariniphaga sp.]